MPSESNFYLWEDILIFPDILKFWLCEPNTPVANDKNYSAYRFFAEQYTF
jgi:hypothetical protein